VERRGIAEARLIAGRPSWLRPVWSSAHWHVFAVRAPTLMVLGPARMHTLSTTAFSVQALRQGQAMVRVRFTPYWSSAGPGCVSAGPNGWTLIHARRAGLIEVHATWTLAGMLRQPDCARD
jgi:hypothetical protein